MLKFFTVIVILVAIAGFVGFKAYTLYGHKGCQVEKRSSMIEQRRFLVALSLMVMMCVGDAFWAELTQFSNFMTYYETGDVIVVNLVTLAMMAFGYYLVLRRMVKKLKTISRDNAEAGARAQILKCRHHCLNAPQGATSPLHCRNLNVPVCPCSTEWDIVVEFSRSDIKLAMRKSELTEFGITEISVPCRRTVRKAAKTTLSAETEQAYICQIIRLLVTTLPDGRVVRKLHREEAEQSRIQ